MSRRLTPWWLCALILLAGCSRQAPLAPTPQNDDLTVGTVDLSALTRIERASRPPVTHGALGRADVVRIPAGSVDALAAALAAAGPHGFVVLAPGVHHENGMVEITQPVVLLGEPGAVLESATPTASLAHPAVVPALWVHGAEGFVMRGVEMRPAGGLGGTAVLLENSDDAAVFQSNLHDWQYGVLVESSNHVKLWDNRVASTLAWTSNPDVPEAHGIIIINGDHALIVRNQVSNSLFGIWACSLQGVAFENRASGNLIGLILCKVPQGSYLLPSGHVVGANSSATQWLAQGNVTTGNFSTGLLIIDGANRNRVVSNESHDNGGYAVEFTADTFRFGFLTPASFNNVFVAGQFPNTQVKDCGNDNRIVGGQLVDNSLEPCN